MVVDRAPATIDNQENIGEYDLALGGSLRRLAHSSLFRRTPGWAAPRARRPARAGADQVWAGD